MEPESRYDLALTFDWEYDRDFIRLVEEAARGRGLKTVAVPPAEAGRALEAFRSGKLDFRILLDRASGASPEFVGLQALASEWAPYNINVNAVAPSLVAKPATFQTRPPEQIKKYLANVPLKRVADPAEVAGTFVFLASPASDFITGQIIYLDGGMTAIG